MYKQNLSQLSRSIFFCLALCTFAVASCEKKNEEELQPMGDNPVIPDSCDNENVSYSGVIQPIFTASCAISGCHVGQGVQFSDGIDLSSYSATEATVGSAMLLGAIKHESGFSSMPRGDSKLSNCKISQIEAWINEGRQNN